MSSQSPRVMSPPRGTSDWPRSASASSCTLTALAAVLVANPEATVIFCPPTRSRMRNVGPLRSIHIRTP